MSNQKILDLHIEEYKRREEEVEKDDELFKTPREKELYMIGFNQGVNWVKRSIIPELQRKKK